MILVELVPISRSGDLPPAVTDVCEEIRRNCQATADFYRIVGFEPPWISYVALGDGNAVGGGAFKGAPRDRRVEIAYYTLPGFENRGFATATARELVRIARTTLAGIAVTAQTLPRPTASNRLLQRLGFSFAGTAEDADAGEVWEWSLRPDA